MLRGTRCETRCEDDMLGSRSVQMLLKIQIHTNLDRSRSGSRDEHAPGPSAA